MKKIAFGILIALIAASPAAAAKKHKKQVAAAEPPPVNQNEASWRLFRDSLPVYLPTAVKMIMYPPGNHQK
jgi:hypothetical protein